MQRNHVLLEATRCQGEVVSKRSPRPQFFALAPLAMRLWLNHLGTTQCSKSYI
jgi:hypothetical protein